MLIERNQRGTTGRQNPNPSRVTNRRIRWMPPNFRHMILGNKTVPCAHALNTAGESTKYLARNTQQRPSPDQHIFEPKTISGGRGGGGGGESRVKHGHSQQKLRPLLL